MNDPNIIYGGDFKNRDNLNLASLGELVIKNLKQGGTNHSFVNGLTGESWSSEDLLKISIKVSHALHNAGVKPGDMVSIVSENCHEFMAVACGSFLLNAVLAPLNYTYTQRKSMS
jgi:acyl-CoA synthetase (AMP-forming)/AMP-acid ligase II